MEDKKTLEQQSATPTGEEKTGEQGRLFTQDEVNAIVRERLAREREKQAEQSRVDSKVKELEEREAALARREARARNESAAREYFQQKGIVGKALDIALWGASREIDALVVEDGKIQDSKALEVLISGVLSGLVAETRTIGAPVAHPPCYNAPNAETMIAEAFKPKI